MEIISSRENPKVKYLAALHDRKKASKEGVVFIEGLRLCEDALSSGVVPSMIVISKSKITMADDMLSKYKTDSEIIYVTDECFSKIASTVNPQGIAMVVPMPENLKDIPFNDDGRDIYVVLEEIQDPGNLGTIIRMADAFGFTAVIMSQGTADPYNEKVLRSSMGSVWHIPLIRGMKSEEIIEKLEALNITGLATHLNGTELSVGREVDIPGLKFPVAFWIGNEGKGLKDTTADKCRAKVKIPMAGRAESLNAASAASIVGFLLASIRDRG